MKQTGRATRDRILDAGLNLLSTSGFAGVTIGLLASQVGMSKSGLFAHFKSKDDIDIALLEQMFEVAQTNVVVPAMRAQQGLSRLTALVENWFGWSTKAGLIGGCPDAAELMGFYLSHHASRRFMRNRDANMRARKAFQGLIDRSRSMGSKRTAKAR